MNGKPHVVTMRRVMTAVALLAAAFCWAAFPAAFAVAAQEPQPAAQPRQLDIEMAQAKPWKGDFDKMLERRVIRVLVPYSRTLYFVDHGVPRGITADLVREFEQYLNRAYAKQLGKRPLTVLLIPTTRDKLLSGVIEGRGDIAAGNLTATDERLKIVDFIAPADRKPVQELIVAGPVSETVATLDDLSGKTLHVRSATSYLESATELNKRLRKARRKPAKIVKLPPELEDEDVMEMLNAGLLQLTIVDDWKARMWAQILPKIKVREDLVMRAGGYTGWAVRKDSPQLVEVATKFYQGVVQKTGGTEARLAQYHKRVKQISNNTAGAEWKRLETTIKLFEKYGTKYNFDPMMLAAQGFQESQLKQEAKSHVGAIGVMQIMPATGKELGVGDITVLEPNIHGGAKYMDQLMTRYFKDANFSEAERPLFAFASYNAGPGNIARMRKLAVQRGLDPDKWFNNVELVVADKIGMETTTYVRNIYKYYVSYKLVMQAHEAARKAREKVK
jgi:membrane-bound lytic murein transglycosylase MltF